MRLHHRASVVALAGLLAGCTSGGNFTYQQYAKLVGQAGRAMFNPVDVPRDAPAAVPYASMGYRLNGGDQTMLVLATKTDQSELWTAGSHVVLQTSHGRITRSVGLPSDLGALQPQQGEALAPPETALKGAFSTINMADYPTIPAYGVVLTCTFAAPQPESITILGQAIDTLRLDESCDSRGMNWRYVNSYWLDPKTGFAWATRQHLGQNLTIDTQIFRPPG